MRLRRNTAEFAEAPARRLVLQLEGIEQFRRQAWRHGQCQQQPRIGAEVQSPQQLRVGTGRIGQRRHRRHGGRRLPGLRIAQGKLLLDDGAQPVEFRLQHAGMGRHGVAGDYFVYHMTASSSDIQG